MFCNRHRLRLFYGRTVRRNLNTPKHPETERSLCCLLVLQTFSDGLVQQVTHVLWNTLVFLKTDSSVLKEVIKKKKEKKSEKMVKNTDNGKLKHFISGKSDKELQSQTEMDSSRLTHKRKKGKKQKANKRQRMLERELTLEG